MIFLPETGNFYRRKDCKKALEADYFIGLGVKGSSTEVYRKLVSEHLVNQIVYPKESVVFISINGSRSNRKGIDHIKKYIDAAIDFNCEFITDNVYDRERIYNMGEREVAKYLTLKGYVEIDGLGRWTKLRKEKHNGNLFEPSDRN